MTKIPIYTVGYGNRSIKQFIELLRQYQIAYVADVRSQPYSRFNHNFSKEDLEKHLRSCNIRYMYVGDTLGGRPKDDTCYADGRVDYSKLPEKSFYQEGIGRLRTAWEKQLRVAVMCTELKPQECHRGKLIGASLIEQQIDVAHIDEEGNIKTQEDINQLLGGNQPTLFGEPCLDKRMGFSRKRYSLRVLNFTTISRMKSIAAVHIHKQEHFLYPMLALLSRFLSFQFGPWCAFR